jgi:hypothetical protein
MKRRKTARKRPSRSAAKAARAVRSLRNRLARLAPECSLAWSAYADRGGGKPVQTAVTWHNADSADRARRTRKKIDPWNSLFCTRLAALANPHRSAIALNLLNGPASHQELLGAVNLKAGPFYFHVNQLRLAGLIGLTGRNSYQLTRPARALLLILCATNKIVSRIAAKK